MCMGHHPLDFSLRYPTQLDLGKSDLLSASPCSSSLQKTPASFSVFNSGSGRFSQKPRNPPWLFIFTFISYPISNSKPYQRDPQSTTRVWPHLATSTISIQGQPSILASRLLHWSSTWSPSFHPYPLPTHTLVLAQQPEWFKKKKKLDPLIAPLKSFSGTPSHSQKSQNPYRGIRPPPGNGPLLPLTASPMSCPISALQLLFCACAKNTLPQDTYNGCLPCLECLSLQ